MKFLCAIFVLFLAALAAQAQDPSKAVSAKGFVSVDKVQQGAAFQIAVVIDIGPEFHINSSKPLDPNLIATKLTPAELEGVVFSPVSYPKGENHKFGFSEQPLSVYSGRAVIKIPARASAKLPLGGQTIKAKLGYQACSNQACFPPKTVEVSIPIEVVDAKTKPSPANQEIFGAVAKPHAVRKK